MLDGRARSWLRGAAVLAASMPIVLVAACSGEEASGTASDEVTSVENTDVKSQAIANCWLYATAGWVESLHKGATARDVDVSEAYWNYWFWYEQISGGSITLNPKTGINSKGAVSQGGWWGVGAELIRRYGYMLETDFIPESDAKAARHTEAVNAINASLASGALRSPDARRDPRILRGELDKAWKLSTKVSNELGRVFPLAAPLAAKGPSSPAASSDAGAVTDVGGADAGPAFAPPVAFVDLADRGVGGKTALVHAPQELSVLGSEGTKRTTLADAVGTMQPDSAVGDGLRVGSEAWSELRYTWNDTAIGKARRSALLKNLKHVLNRRLAVPLAWVTAKGAKEGVYRAEMVNDTTIGGLHESILVDYEIDDVPGFGTLRVDEREARPEALEATLDDAANVRFFRIKNSWGTERSWSEEEMRQYGLRSDADGGLAAKPNYLPTEPGYNDLFSDYLDRATTKGNKIDGHMMLRIAMPARLRFAVPDMPPPPDADGGSDGGASDGGPTR